MDRLARLRTRSSAGGPLNASTTSSLAAGYETANDESVTSGCSMYFSMTEGGGDGSKNTGEVEDEIALEEEPTLSGTLATTGSGVDQTLENDFSVEEVSTIRKATIAHASPATVQVASGMAIKYLGVSSTPAPKTPKAAKTDLSGIDQLEQTPSILKKMRDPKTPAECSFGEDPEESKVTLDGSGVHGPPPPGNKSYGTNVLSNFFASLDVNSGTPLPPEIRINEPEAAGTTPSKRESNSCENFFESLKKDPAPEAEKENKRKSIAIGVRKSLIPKVASILATTKENRVASPISRKPTAVKLLPDKLREMRKTNNDQLVNFRRKSVVPAATTLKKSDEVTAKVNTGLFRKSMAVATTAVVRATTAPAATTGAALKRKSIVVPTTKTTTAVNGRKSVLPAPGVRRSVLTASAASSRVALKIPAKTTLATIPDSTSTASTRRTLLGKRPATTLTATLSMPEKTAATEPPQAKQRKSLAPVKEGSPALRVSPRTTSKPVQPPLPSRIRPPTATTSVAAGFKKPETFTCDQCQRIFRLKSSYETHLKTVHQTSASTNTTSNGHNKSTEGTSATAAAKCQYCGKGFAAAKFLTKHIVSNCVKIPLLEKRRLLAEGEQQRAANLKRTPENAAARKRMSLRPPTSSSSSTGSVNRSNSSTRSGDETDTSTCSSNGGTASSGPRTTTTTAKAGHGGISRTPNKELKCHLCARRFLNAVEYALHVQAHAKNLKTGGGGGDADPGQQKLELEQSEDVAKLVQKLTSLKNRNGGIKLAVSK